MKRTVLQYLLLVILAAVFVACSERKDDAPSQVHSAAGDIPVDHQEPASVPTRVEISDEIRSAWKGIRVEVVHLASGTAETLVIDIGGVREVGSSGIRIKALNFLPAFQMNVPVITSRSNKLENPAAQIEVYEGETRIFKGWLFTLYPTTHAFTHPKYSLTLIEGVAAEKK